MSALVAKCQVVEDSDTPASAATPRWVTAATPSRATIRDGRGDDRLADPLGGLGARAGDGGHGEIVTSTYVLANAVRAY